MFIQQTTIEDKKSMHGVVGVRQLDVQIHMSFHCREKGERSRFGGGGRREESYDAVFKLTPVDYDKAM